MEHDIRLHKNIILYILQITTLYNAMVMGWKVKKIGDKTYELSKKINEVGEFGLKNFMEQITCNEYLDPKKVN